MSQIVELRSSASRLREALDQLEIAWTKTREHWTDAASHRFEQEHLIPMKPQIRSALDAIAHIDQIIRQADRECS